MVGFVLIGIILVIICGVLLVVIGNDVLGVILVVFDVILLEGSLVKDYRNQFSRTIRKKGGYDGLIQSLKEKYNE